MMSRIMLRNLKIKIWKVVSTVVSGILFARFLTVDCISFYKDTLIEHVMLKGGKREKVDKTFKTGEN